MYTICSRCQFKVPATKHICHICGNTRLKDQRSSFSSAKCAVATSAMNNFVANSNALGSDVVEVAAQLGQVCNQVRTSTKEAFSLMKQQFFTTIRPAKEVVTVEQRLDYLTAYKASIKGESSSNGNSSPREKEPKRKVEMLDETSVTRLHLDELVNWFEEFGKEGIIIPTAKDVEASQLSDAA